MTKHTFSFVVILLFSSYISIRCTDDEDFQSNNSQLDISTDTNSNIDYPSTANVIHNAVVDIDGNSYDAVQIGNQIWMASNLRTTHEPDGEEIPEGSNLEPAAIPYRYTPHSNITLYGYLYNYDALLHGSSPSITNPSGVQGICPNGWHVPSLIEWQEMVNYVANHISPHTSIALASNSSWRTPPSNWTEGGSNIVNATGFTAVPAGRSYSHYNSYYDYTITEYQDMGRTAIFWTATTSSSNDSHGLVGCKISYESNVNIQCVDFNTYSYYGLQREIAGASVRCVKD